MNDELDQRERLDPIITWGVLCLLATAFVLLSLLSHDPADLPGRHVYPGNSRVSNLCGPVGAHVAHGLVASFGVGSLVSGAAGVFLTVGLWRRRPRRELIIGMSGFALLSVTVAGLVHQFSHWNWLSSVAGPGGAIGSAVFHALQAHLSLVGTNVVLIPLVVVGALLAMDSLLAAMARATLFAIFWTARHLFTALQWLAQHRPTIRWPRQSARPPRPTARPPALRSVDITAEVDEEVDELDDEENELEQREDLVETGDAEPVDPDVAAPEVWEHPAQGLRIVRNGFDEAEFTIAEPVAAPAPVVSRIQLPELELLDDSEPFEFADHEQEVYERAALLEKTFAQFNMRVKVVQIDTGPVVTQYEIELEPGLRAKKVMALSDDLAIALRAPSVRIVAPIPGKNTVGIEVPNERRAKVSLKEVIVKSGATTKMRLPMFLGKDVKGQPLVCDLAKMPHLLIAGRTGTGKSVCLNTLILSLLMTRTPEQVRMLMIDPKMVELSLYRDIPHLLHPVVTDMRKAEALLAWAVDKMEQRYKLLSNVGVRHIDAYNNLSNEERKARLESSGDTEQGPAPEHLPYLVIFADEMADLMMTAAKEVEAHIIRLAQKSRAVGIHLVLATQKPTVDVITGLIKSNLPARIAFQVASRTDSRVVLDEMGADKLLGNGDMLFLYPGTSKILRAQGTFVSDEEVMRLTEFLSAQAKPQFSQELIQLEARAENDADAPKSLADRDDLYEQAIDVVVRERRGSVSLLQRALGIGYGRSARLIDYMYEDGIVGEYNGSQAREVLYTPEQWDEKRGNLFGIAG